MINRFTDLKTLNLTYLDLDIFDERTTVVEAQIVEAEYWIKRLREEESS